MQRVARGQVGFRSSSATLLALRRDNEFADRISYRPALYRVGATSEACAGLRRAVRLSRVQVCIRECAQRVYASTGVACAFDVTSSSPLLPLSAVTEMRRAVNPKS